MTQRGSHFHPEYATEQDQHRMEDRINARLDRLESRMTMLMGGLGVLAFLIPIVTPFVRGLLGIPIQTP